MRRLALILGILVVTTVAGVAVQVTLQYFQAKSNGTSVSLEWKSNNEPELVQYEIERAGEDNSFRYIATVQAKGNNQAYSYRDDEAFGKRDGNDGAVARNYFTYRLKMIGADQSTSYSNTVGVTHNVSGIKRTWGMIKEMFR
ncbi:MAG TPA: hypothetical protein VK147_10050 [Candidatus Didemnitutus sp.]|nr:hypothetical protein [Candidatus Didemnitutus sp.]